MDRLPPEDALEAALHFSEGGPVAAAQEWLERANAGDFGGLWGMTDPNLRLVIAQDWIWANRTHPDFESRDIDELARGLAFDVPSGDLAESFTEIQLGKFQDIGYVADDWGVASRPRLIAPDYELVLFIDTEGEVLVINKPTFLETDLSLLMHSVEGRWLVGGFTDQIPRPGWPPVDSGLG
jgi:hypothetical protein